MDNAEQLFLISNLKQNLQNLVSNWHQIYPSQIDEWKKSTLPHLEGSYYVKLNRTPLLEDSFVGTTLIDKNIPFIYALLDDLIFKYAPQKMTEERLKILKLLKAREENQDFEKELALMITGDNTNFPYRSSYYLTDFFQKLGFNFTHSGETRRIWVEERLLELNIQQLYSLIATGLFKKKYFLDHCKNKDVVFDEFYPNAIQEFKKFIEHSLTAEDPFDLSHVLGLNVNIELLFENKANTTDQSLNELIEEAKDRFSKNDRQIALEKIWDGFERIKTYYHEKDKKTSAEKLLSLAAKDFDFEFLNDEFKKLTDIGNGFRIRHHEKGKKELSNEHINYLFFRMLSLIDLCLISIKIHASEDMDLF